MGLKRNLAIDHLIESYRVDNELETLDMQFLIIVFIPKAETFVCPTEVAEYLKILPEVEMREGGLMFISKSKYKHWFNWIRESKYFEGILNKTQHTYIPDATLEYSDSFGAIDFNPQFDEIVPTRTTLIISIPDRKVVHRTFNDWGVGRSTHETLRVLDGLLTDEMCPCNREVGGKTIIPTRKEIEENKLLEGFKNDK